MAFRPRTTHSETQKRRLLLQRMTVVHGFFLLAILVIVARLIDLQVVKGQGYRDEAASFHYDRNRKLPARRGEILGISSRTGEQNIFATNITLDMVYVDPLSTDDPAFVANTLADTVLTEEVHAACSGGKDACPRELIPFYSPAFDPLEQKKILESGSLLEPLPPGSLPAKLLHLPDFAEAQRLFASSIKNRISQKRVTFSPLKYGATKAQMAAVIHLELPGISVVPEEALIYANPEEVAQNRISTSSLALAQALSMDPAEVGLLLKQRDLRYVSVMHRLPPAVSLQIRTLQLQSLRQALANRTQQKNPEGIPELRYPLRGIALLSEQWRFYPDGSVAAHVVGFVNAAQEPQYGIERTFNPQLRGQAGLISTVHDPSGAQIVSPDQEIVNPTDGDTIVLTLDRTVQKFVEETIDAAVKKTKSDSGEAIVMDPFTGRIIAMANSPLFDGNHYAGVYEKEPLTLDSARQEKIAVEIYHPVTGARVVNAYRAQVFTPEGRTMLSEKTRKAIEELEQQYDLKDVARYYLYIGETLRQEIFPTDKPDVWLTYRNRMGVGAYLNRTVQEIYEPGSVLKPITMAIALDQGEVRPEDTYLDDEPVKPDEKHIIYNNDHKFYGLVTMTNCLEFSINTCMTSISAKLGAKLFQRMLDRFGFGKITGIELEDELPGSLKTWSKWSRAELATIAFGQGISATPLQVITGWAALANGGKLLKPTIIDSIIHADGSVEKTQTKVLDQVITKEASETITAMLVSSAEKGFAKTGKVKGYRIAGKTGTSQIAGPNQGYETGTGSTYAGYAGYAPVEHPRFLILIKLDRPQSAIHGATAAAPVFKDIAAFLFGYYGIPPDEKK